MHGLRKEGAVSVPEPEHLAQLREALGLGDDFEGGWIELLQVVRDDYRLLREIRKVLET